MFSSFNPNANHAPAVDLIPAGTLAFAVVKVESINLSKSTGGKNAKLELTISQGPFANRKVWHYLGDPTDPKNSEKYQQMSLGALQAMLEAGGIFNPADPASYQKFAASSFEQVMAALDAKTAAIKTKLAKGTGGYEDKVVVGDWLSPNPAGRQFKKWQELLQGGGAAQAPAAPQFAAQAAAPAAAPAAAGGVPAWLQGQAR